MVHPVQVRPISNDEGNRLLRIVRRGTGSVVTWRRAQMVLLSAQHMPVAKIAEVTFPSPDRVRDVLHNFNTDGFDSLYPRYAGGRPPKFDPKQRATIKQIALSRPADHDLPFSGWSLSKLADFLSTRTDDRIGRWAAANNVEIAYTPFYGSWLNRIEAQFTALRYFTLDGTDHPSHREQASMIRRYIAWRNRHTTDPRLRKVIKRASTITRAKVA